MTFTFDLETLYKVAAHPLPENSVYVKYEPKICFESLLWRYEFDP